MLQGRLIQLRHGLEQGIRKVAANTRRILGHGLAVMSRSSRAIKESCRVEGIATADKDPVNS